MAGEDAIRQMAEMGARGMAERVLYRPSSEGIADREIWALVDRKGPQDHMSGNAKGFELTVLNDEEHGIPSAPTLSDMGKDQVDVAERIGGELAARNIREVLKQDPDMMTLFVM